MTTKQNILFHEKAIKILKAIDKLEILIISEQHNLDKYKGREYKAFFDNSKLNIINSEKEIQELNINYFNFTNL